MNPERQLRLKQIVCISFLVVILLLRHLGFMGNPSRRAMNLSQFLVIVAALWSAVSWFTVHRRLAARPQRHSTGSPIGRWVGGHIMRLLNATAVGMWALLLYYLGGPPRVVDAFFAIALILLILWRPGAHPSQETNVPG